MTSTNAPTDTTVDVPVGDTVVRLQRLDADHYVVRRSYGSTIGCVVKARSPWADRPEFSWLADNGSGTRHVTSPTEGAEFLADPVAFATR